MARFILREGQYRPIRGSVLLIGRQTIHLTPQELQNLFREEGMTIDPAIPVSLDTTTQKGRGKGFVSDAYFFRALGAGTVTALDVSDYEGAEMVHNLDTPIPSALEGKFDFICNGSVLDNMFNPVMGIINIARMLSAGGRALHFEHASNAVNNAYLQFSPNWFFDYYVVNNFADCKSYVALFLDPNGPWDFYACTHDHGTEPGIFRSSRFAMTAVVAEKSADSTSDKIPTQAQYREATHQAQFLQALRRMSASPRPVMAASRTGGVSRARRRLLELFTLVRHAPTPPQRQSAFDALMSVLPPRYFARRRGYLPLGKFY